MSSPVGVLVMAHGTPGSPGEIGAFSTRIRRGRPPSPEQLDELVRRYEAIGGVSPLTERTSAQVQGLASLLEADAPGRYVVAYGAKHAEPSVERAAAELAARGVSTIVGIVLTPHRSTRGSEEYLDRAAAAIGAGGARFVRVEQWFDAPGLAELLADRLHVALDALGGDPTVLFSAHSVPESAPAAGDPYRDQVERSAELVAEAARLEASSVPWRVAWQSAGRTGERWLGPDLAETLDELAAGGCRSVVVCPVGFVSDHLEILYDLDIEARARATSLGLGFARTESLNDDPRFVAVLAGVVAAAAGAAPR